MLPRCETSDYSPAQKIVIFLGIATAVALVAMIGNFIYEFIQTFKTELNNGLFYGLAFLEILFLIVATYSAFYVLAMLSSLHYQSKRQQIRATAANTALFNATIEQISSGAVYLSEQRNDYGTVKFRSLPKHAKQQPKTELLESVAPPISEATPEPEIKTTLLNDIEQCQRLLLVGGQNSGKTTLLKHIARQRSSAGSVLVLDSHNTLGKWSSDYRIVGHGRDYNAIETELKNLVAVMDSRYKELASDKIKEREHELITVISDEWTTVSKNIDNLDCYLLPLLTESRKVGIDLILATHSQTAESLGLKGKADLKTAFDAVLILKNISGKRLIDLYNGESIINYHHCGAFIENRYAIKPSPQFTKTLDSILSKDLILERKIIDTYHELINSNSFSWNKLSKAIYGNSNGAKVAELKRILESHGIVTSQ